MVKATPSTRIYIDILLICYPSWIMFTDSIFSSERVLHFCTACALEIGGWGGWWSYKVQDFDTGYQSLHPESTVWLDLSNKNTLLMEGSWFWLNGNKVSKSCLMSQVTFDFLSIEPKPQSFLNLNRMLWVPEWADMAGKQMTCVVSEHFSDMLMITLWLARHIRENVSSFL